MHEAPSERLLRERTTGDGHAARGQGEGQGEGADRARPIRCRRCDGELCDERAIFSPLGGPVRQLFVNPTGRACEVLTVRDASPIVLYGISTLEATWFAGCSWQLALCGRCAGHVGWRYEGAVPSTAGAFFGLLCEAIVLP